MKPIVVATLSAVMLAGASLVQASAATDRLQQQWAKAGAGQADAGAGRQLWNRDFRVQGEMRRCAACHTDDPRQAGKHVATGKAIDPLAPSVNPASLTDPDQINKWLTRNCKWTLARDCTAQEKADVLEYLKHL